MRTALHELADLKLGGDGALKDLVLARRAEGVSWRLIARDVYDATGVDVTHESLRSWFPEKAEATS